MEEIAKKVHEWRVKWYRNLMRRRGEHYIGRRRAMELKVRYKGEGREEYFRVYGWTNWRTISKIKDCRLMKCTTVLHGGVCRRKSTPHKWE